MKKIDSIEGFEQALKESGNLYLLKHSLTCPISSAAFSEYTTFSEGNPQFNNCFLAVQEARELSNYIAEKYHIKHESPQAILIMNEDVVWHASHWKITKDALTKAFEENT